MKLDIKNMLGEVIYSYDCENNSLKTTLEHAIKNKANLTGADLTEANLTGADLTEANLTMANLTGANLTGARLYCANLIGARLYCANLTRANLTRADLTEADLAIANLTWANLLGVTGNMIEVCSMQLDTYNIEFTKDILQIGCEQYTHKEWFDFDDEKINSMGKRKSLELWKKWKGLIFMTIDLKFGAIKTALAEDGE